MASYQVELMAAQDFCQDDEFGIHSDPKNPTPGDRLSHSL